MTTVGIVTFDGNFNYGNRLQLYATCRVYESLGLDAKALIPEKRPSPQKELVRITKNVVKSLLGRPTAPRSPEDVMSAERLSAFKQFNERIPTLYVPRRSEDALNAEFDFFSAGSDQIWNLDYIKGYDDWYFLKFARPEQRIALAPSVGLDKLNSEQARRLGRGVRGFDHPSVRESRGAELIKECSGIDAEIICDPTLLLTSEEWRAVASKSLTPDGPYIFSYLLGGVDDNAKTVLNRVTDHGRIPVVSLSDREEPDEPPAGPAEFIGLVDNALHVVTDSFHAAVFSCLMETPLTIVRRGGDGGGMFSRLETLAETLGIERKVYRPEGFDLSVAGDYAGVPERIQHERDHFMGYLTSRIGGADGRRG